MTRRNMETNLSVEEAKGKMSCCSRCRSVVSDNKVLVIMMSAMCIALIAVTLYLTLRTEAKQQVPKFGVSDGFRLPGDVIPKHYALEVQAYLTPGRFAFDGSLQIFFTCAEETDAVVLHSKKLSFGKDDIGIRSVGNPNPNPKIKSITFNETSDFLILRLFSKLYVNADYVLSVKYSGVMNNNGTGLYYSSYIDQNEVMHYLANTQLEPTHAREVFPCFDEPQFKATFGITIVRRRNVTSLSNMPKIKVEPRGDGWEADIYATSMKMSTYLVAFAIGNFVGIQEGKVGIWAPKGLNESKKFALDVSVKLLRFFEDMLGVPYDAPKLDMAAVLELQGNAMENWGLVLYLREQLLVDAWLDIKQQKVEIVNTIAHEIAHQWFGNLVTMKWWSDLWLNEGFANYLQDIAVQSLFPEFRARSESIFSFDCCPDWTVGMAGIYGAGCNSNPGDQPSTVWKNVTGADGLLADKLFDRTVYYKGRMIVAMVHHVLGNETFWKFLRTYLKENAYGNVDETDLWILVRKVQSGQRYEKLDVANMKSWAHLPGIPIVSVERNYQEGRATFSQKSCRGVGSNNRGVWPIPLSYRTSHNGTWKPQIRTWLTGIEATATNMPSEDDWILANDEASNFYIVSYDRRNWHLLSSQLKKDHTVFTSKQRYKILADANNLHRLNYSGVTIEILLDLSAYLHFEKEWKVFGDPNYNTLMNIHPLMMQSSLIIKWKEFSKYIFGPLYDILLRGNESSVVIRVEEFAYWLCQFSYSQCVEDALRIAEDWRDGINQIGMKKFDTDIALCTTARENNRFSDYLLDEYGKRGKSPEILEALFCSYNSSIIERLFQEYEKSRSPSFFDRMLPLVDNEKHWEMLLDFIDKHLLRATNNLRVYSGMTTLFQQIRRSPVQAERLLEIMKRHFPGVTNRSSKRKLQNEIAEIETNIPKIRSLVLNVENWLGEDRWRRESRLNFRLQ